MISYIEHALTMTLFDSLLSVNIRAIMFSRVDTLSFALVRRTDTQIRNILRIYLINTHLLLVSHLRSYRANVQIQSHHALSKLFF